MWSHYDNIYSQYNTSSVVSRSLCLAKQKYSCCLNFVQTMCVNLTSFSTKPIMCMLADVCLLFQFQLIKEHNKIEWIIKLHVRNTAFHIKQHRKEMIDRVRRHYASTGSPVLELLQTCLSLANSSLFLWFCLMEGLLCSLIVMKQNMYIPEKKEEEEVDCCHCFVLCIHLPALP